MSTLLEATPSLMLAPLSPTKRRVVVYLVASAAFLVMFQGYLLAPLVPFLAHDLRASVQLVGLLVPGYTLAYGFVTLFYGSLADRVGVRPVFFSLLGATTLLAICTAGVPSASALLTVRVLAGLAAGGVVPLGVVIIGQLYPFAERGRPIGLLFGAVAGGTAFGSTLGAYLNPVLGWRVEFMGVAVLAAVLLGLLLHYRTLFRLPRTGAPRAFAELLHDFGKLLTQPASRLIYLFIGLNGLFHAGIFAWLGVYFAQRYGLGDQGIGLALLGYGIPGMLAGTLVGRLADRYGRGRLVRSGLLLSASMAGLLACHIPLWAAGVTIALLSFGFDLTQPLFATLVTNLPGVGQGQAVSLSTSVLFVGYGVGALLFEYLLKTGFTGAFTGFAGLECCLFFATSALFADNKSVSH